MLNILVDLSIFLLEFFKINLTYFFIFWPSGTSRAITIFKLSRFQNRLALTNEIIFIYAVRIADHLKVLCAENSYHSVFSQFINMKKKSIYLFSFDKKFQCQWFSSKLLFLRAEQQFLLTAKNLFAPEQCQYYFAVFLLCNWNHEFLVIIKYRVVMTFC